MNETVEKAPSRIEPADYLAMVWRERRTALLVAGIVVVLGLAIALLQPRIYEAKTRLLIRLGQEYVYQPRVGDTAAPGSAPPIQEVINAELRLLESPEITRRTIARIGIRRLYPEIARAGREKNLRVVAAAEKAFERQFEAWGAPKTPIVLMRFRHKDRAIASQTLEALTAEYMAYRRSILVDPAGGGYAQQGRDYTVRAAGASKALQSFLVENKIADFDSEMKVSTDLLGRSELELAEATAKRRELEGRTASLRQRVNGQPAEIELYAEVDAGKRLIDMRIEREQLLARYQPNAAPVVEIERRIAQVQNYIDAERRAGLTRRGPNPVRQAIETELYQVEAEARAQGAREAALITQRKDVETRLRQLQVLEPKYRELARDRTILEDNARALSTRAVQTGAFSALSGVETDNIRQMEPAAAPLQGQSPRLEIGLAALALALVAGLVAALWRGLGRVSFPTPSSAARILGAPVLGVSTDRRAA